MFKIHQHNFLSRNLKQGLALFLMIMSLSQITPAHADKAKVKLNVKETLVTKLQPWPERATTTQFDYLPWGYHLSWSPDMRRVVYWAIKNNGMFLVANGVAGKPFDITDDGSPRGGLEPPRVTFTPDSRHFMYAARRGKKSFLVFDGKESKPYDAIRDFSFSPDFAHYAYVAKRGSKFLVVHDGKEGKLYDWIAPKDLHFSADSKRLAYWSKRAGKNFIVLHNGATANETFFNPKSRKTKPVTNKTDNTSTVMPTGRGTVKTIQRDGKTAFVINGIEQRPYSYHHEAHFSPDGKHFAFYASRDNEGFIVVDGVEVADTYDDATGLVVPPLVFDSPNSLHTLALRGNSVFRVEIEIVALT
jgi:hypothetical protein